MPSSISPQLIATLLEIADVAPDATRPEAAATWLGAQLEGIRPAIDDLAFEAEPAGFVLEIHGRAR
ncbi:MAG: hypothetical protein LJE90_12690 [Betaproteobacteria bacterium]|jgi:hypothetical protein|nr:hypothetical protein [Betaproteobacteria bacterium]